MGYTEDGEFKFGYESARDQRDRVEQFERADRLKAEQAEKEARSHPPGGNGLGTAIVAGVAAITALIEGIFG